MGLSDFLGASDLVHGGFNRADAGRPSDQIGADSVSAKCRDCCTSLVQLLRQLTVEIIRAREDAAHPDRTRLPVSRWEDDDYVYFEIDFPGSPVLVADISVLADHVFIRVGQAPPPAPSPSRDA
jgi:hypothetical protein